MEASEIVPCYAQPQWVQMVIAVGVIFNTALATWLAHRRYRQDRFNRSPERKAFESWRRFIFNRKDTDSDDRDNSLSQ
jgi:hypothetical protein